MIFITLFLILKFCALLKTHNAEDNVDSKQKKSQLEVRPIFLKCETNLKEDESSDEAARFEREELFKHNALRDCNKKLALTIKITSEPMGNSGDEYIPIEHVFDGPHKKRIRLLNPYVLRLRRDAPLEAYKLRRIETVIGILTKNEDTNKKTRVQRNSLQSIRDHIEDLDLLGNAFTLIQSTNESGLITDSQPPIFLTPPTSAYKHSRIGRHHSVTSLGQRKHFRNFFHAKNHSKGKYEACNKSIMSTCKRDKRHEHNIIVGDVIEDDKIPWVATDGFYQTLDRDGDFRDNFELTSRMVDISDNSYEKPLRNSEYHSEMKSTEIESRSLTALKELKRNKHDESHYSARKSDGTTESLTKLHKKANNPKIRNSKEKPSNNKAGSIERDFTMYEIGNPDIWYTVNVQLFEKLNTPDGKTIWNDITKGELASVDSVNTEWAGQDMYVKYKNDEWLPRESYTLSNKHLCLLAPVTSDYSSVEIGNFIIVPVDDVVSAEDESLLNKRNENQSDVISSNAQNEERHQRVFVRLARALINDEKHNIMNIVNKGSSEYLTLPHRKPHHAQIDLEVRADANQLVRVGSSGRITTLVTDNTRRTRTILTVQATNTGLAAARFRATLRDCGPELSGLINDKYKEDLTTERVLLPPRHTRRLKLELPVEAPVDTVHCSVALLNEDEEAVAVRDVAIKKGDRCFCVWHCDCVCLIEDPKLMCREMTEARQTAAGLSSRKRTRQTRSICYPDVVSVNLCVVIVGVLMTLLVLGLVKACLGLIFRCIGSCGLGRLLQMPRKLDRYYESCLSCRPVVYDDEGWPVHPDTKQRTVRLVSRPMEFILNMLFFIALPCVILWDTFRRFTTRCHGLEGSKTTNENEKKCYSSHDIQAMELRLRRRKGRLRRWMTPQAEELSTVIWRKGLEPGPSDAESMHPLLPERCCVRAEDPPSSCVDSEQDDTEYVLMQMQKSRESLAKSQRKLSETRVASAGIQGKRNDATN